jgi:hypothetical protein
MKRSEIFARDGYRCVFCGQVFPAEELTVDHLQARSRGGDRSGGNLVTACKACNARKGRQRLAYYLADNPDVYATFRQLAVHAWKRHLVAIDEEILKIEQASATGGRRLRSRRSDTR